MATEIREAKPGEAPLVAAINRRAFAEFIARFGRAPSSQTETRAQAAIERRRVWQAGARKAPPQAAAAFSRGEKAWVLDQLAVPPEAQSLGLGRHLIAALEDAARADGAERLELLTAAMMTHLVAFYSRLGFVVEKVGPPDHTLDAHPRVHLAKSLI